jgi:hypothetical protein
MKGIEIFEKIWKESEGMAKFADHPLAQIEFEEKTHDHKLVRSTHSEAGLVATRKVQSKKR